MSRKPKEEQLTGTPVVDGTQTLPPDGPNQPQTQPPAVDQQPPAPPEKQGPATIVVTWAVNVKHNQRRYRAGDKTEIAEDEYPELLRAKVILPSEE